jgi:hypothetical protein
LAGERAAVWVHGETLTMEHETETLAHDRVELESDGRRRREVNEPRFFATAHQSPQPFLAPLEETAWHPARRLAPDRTRRRRDETTGKRRASRWSGSAPAANAGGALVPGSATDATHGCIGSRG